MQFGLFDERPAHFESLDELIATMMKMEDDPLFPAGTNMVICRGNPAAHGFRRLGVDQGGEPGDRQRDLEIRADSIREAPRQGRVDVQESAVNRVDVIADQPADLDPGVRLEQRKQIEALSRMSDDRQLLTHAALPARKHDSCLWIGYSGT